MPEKSTTEPEPEEPDVMRINGEEEEPFLSIDLPEQRCAACGYKFDQTTGLDTEAQPRPGDVSICIACGAIQIFKADLTMRNPTAQERLKCERNQQIIDAQFMRAHFIGDKIKARAK